MTNATAVQSGAATTTTNNESSQSQNSRSSNPRRRQGGRGRGRGGGRQNLQSSRSNPQNQEQEQEQEQDQNLRRQQHTRSHPRAQSLVASSTTGRRFGGQLSSTTTSQSNSSDLRAVATSFVPASVAPIPPPPISETAPTTSRPQSRASEQQSSRPPKSKAKKNKDNAPLTKQISRSTAPDLATRIHEDIAHNLYECAICSNEVGRRSKVWSCNTCWTVFHIGCIKKWSKNEGSAVHRPAHDSSQDHDNIGKQWRCPGCNLPKDSHPSNYNCWCEKELDPKAISGLPPHSCGQTCGRDRKFPKACPHPCDQICHAGPCPPCTSIGPVQSCFCGKQSSTRRCLETDYEAGWSCGQVCGDIMPCGEHACQLPCHEGLCGACTEQVPAKCYCGKVEKTLPCHQRQKEKQSYAWLGSFTCQDTCGRAFDCGIHTCQKECHSQDESTTHCPQSPDMVTTCSCGKTPLAQISSSPRTSCSDPVPNCDQPCNKILRCGHACLKSCHVGDCPPCLQKTTITCRCGRNTFNTTCNGGYGEVEQPWCMRNCRHIMNCGRHECGEPCCPGEKAAAERLASKRGRKQYQNIQSSVRLPRENFEAEHICTRVCDRPLKCGNHSCPELCHKGPCASCKEAIFDDIACNCGRTVLQAPLPCGTRPPPCNYPCNRRKACGHPQVAHNCHMNEEECPKCPFLTEKGCLCGKKKLKNQPCWRSDVLCGLVCGKTLKCGSHMCRKLCHRPGECEDATIHCQQECGKPKKTCGHPCEMPCHAPATCKEDKPCSLKVIITCDCQRKKEEVRCNVKAGVPDPPSRQNSLKCDDECARLERNKRLAAALHIADDHVDDHIPYSTATLSMYLGNTAWCHEQEEILRLFAADDKEKRYRFKPMRPKHRAFIHSLAEDFGFDGESLDPEPHRHVVLFKTPKFVAAPMKTLAQAARIQRAQLAAPATISGITTPERRADEVKAPEYNGLLLKKPRFALTEDEIRPVLQSVTPANNFDVVFLSSQDAVALLPRDEWSGQEQIQTLIETLQPIVSSAISREGLAVSAILCEFDLNTNGGEPRILNEAGQNTTMGIAAGGWNQVAAKKGAPIAPPLVAPVGQKSSFTILGSKLAEAKRKKAEEIAMEKRRQELLREEIIEDWSADVEEEEEEEEENARKDQTAQDAEAYPLWPAET